MERMLLKEFPTSSVQFPTVDKNNMVVAQTYEVERHSASKCKLMTCCVVI